MINLSDLTSDDHVVVYSAIESFLEDGYNRHTDDEEVIAANLKTSKDLLTLLNTDRPKLNLEHFRVMYSALLDLEDDINEAISLGAKDGRMTMILNTCNKLNPRFEKLFDSI